MLQNDLFGRLARETRPILLYGMGDGADKILAESEKHGIAVAGVFASDGFVRGQVFHGMRVQAFSEVRAAYAPGSCVILLAFGSARPEVIAAVERVAEYYEVLVPDMPVCGGPLFDAAFAAENAARIAAARSLWADAESAALFDAILDFRLNGSLRILLNAVSTRTPWDYLAESGQAIRRAADFGAYRGDSAREALLHYPLEFLLAAEPDPRNFQKLEAYCATLSNCMTECHRVAVCDRRGEAVFTAKGNRNARIERNGGVFVPTDTPDLLLAGRTVDYMKYDIEGAEEAALRGSAETICTHRPALRIALYHRSGDMFGIPLLLRDICPHYRFYLTRARSMPAWDIDLVALPIHDTPA